MAPSAATTGEWRVSGSYFEGCNCEAICPCRSVNDQPGGPSTYGECFGAVSWHVLDGHAGPLGLADRLAVLSIRYFDRVPPATPWEAVLYVDDEADDDQLEALADIFLGRAGGTVARQYGPAIGNVHGVRRARIRLEHEAPRRRIAVAGYITVEAAEEVPADGPVRCGIPGFDHPGIELYNDGVVDGPGAAMGGTGPRRVVRV